MDTVAAERRRRIDGFDIAEGSPADGLEASSLPSDATACAARSLFDMSHAVPTFRPEVQNEITSRLGAPCTRSFLLALLDQCKATLTSASGPRERLLPLAHDLASTAGMLGYEEVSLRCRELLGAGDGGAGTGGLGGLEAALHRTIDLLQAQTHFDEAA